jgi:hypothetical protein
VEFGILQNTTLSTVGWKVSHTINERLPADIHKVSAGMKGKKNARN